jgi:carboxymethylenebutenolidase
VRKTLFGYAGQLTPTAVAGDAKAYVAFLDAQPQTDRSKPAGVQGYCMGGSLSVRTAAAAPDRIGAVGTFHGGNGMATDKPESPHLLIPQTKATFLVCQAQNDDAQQPLVKDILKAALGEAGRPATVEVYPANHGWCVKGGQAYDEAQAERAWTALSELYRSTLA